MLVHSFFTLHLRFSPFVAFAGMLAACSSESASPGRGTPDAVLTTAGFEQSMGWGDANPASLTTEKAHTGKWSVCVSPTVPFGYTYARALSDPSNTPLTNMRL